MGLRENPFKNITEQRYFYADQNRAQILESTEHLIEYSSNFQVIIGESGVGKSHLLEALANRLDNNWRVAKIHHADQYDTLALIQTILDAFGAVSDGTELLEILETELAEISQLGFKPVLFIDSADVLSIDSLQFLIQLSQQKQNEEPYVNIVLFAAQDITESLQSQELRNYREVIHIATLNRFDKEGVSGYLRHRMAVVGYDRESPFTPRIIDSIFNDSTGLPEKINYYADKFLTSSGKADNYIDQQDNENSMPSLNDGVQENRNDRAAEQLNRLAEKFEEIEQLDEQPIDSFFSDKELDEGDITEAKPMSNDFHNEAPERHYDDEDSSSTLPKFIIPVAVIGILIVAVIVISNVFNQSEQDVSQQSSNEKIELLPLELPPQGSVKVIESAPQITLPEADSAVNVQAAKPAETVLETDTNVQIDSNEAATESNPAEFVIQSEPNSKLEVVEPVDTQPAVKEPLMVPSQNTVLTSADLTPALLSAEPAPVIGAKSRQYITIVGNNLNKDTLLMVTWGNNKKEFSAKQTPEQWQFIDKNKIKLHLSTGIESQQWHVVAKNANGAQSAAINFDVVMPFIAKIEIKNILPKPLIGSDKRQAVTIMGQGFSQQTVLELRWDKNKKHFSSRLTPSQFEFINDNEIKLFIATGTKERSWHVQASNDDSNISKSSFHVVSKSTSKDVNKINATPANSGKTLKNETWLQQQPDTNYTIQLFGSHNKQAIDELVKKHGLTEDMLRFETQRDGKNWYTLTYGSFESKQLASAAVTTLSPSLARPAPWIRSMASIKAAVQDEIPTVKKPVPVTAQPTADLAINVSSEVKNEAWIWTQNPADYTVQLIALSSENGVKAYIKQSKIQSESVYFKTIRNDKVLYILLYGQYTDKIQATQAAEKLAAQIKGSKPWVRSFSVIHGMMNNR